VWKGDEPQHEFGEAVAAERQRPRQLDERPPQVDHQGRARLISAQLHVVGELHGMQRLLPHSGKGDARAPSNIGTLLLQQQLQVLQRRPVAGGLDDYSLLEAQLRLALVIGRRLRGIEDGLVLAFPGDVGDRHVAYVHPVDQQRAGAEKQGPDNVWCAAHLSLLRRHVAGASDDFLEHDLLGPVPGDAPPDVALVEISHVGPQDGKVGVLIIEPEWPQAEFVVPAG